LGEAIPREVCAKELRRMRRVVAGAVVLFVSLVAVRSQADETDRSFGVGVGGGYGWAAVDLTGDISGSATGAAVLYPTLELKFFNDHQGSWDVSVPVGNTIQSAVNGATAVGATVYYSPRYGGGTARGVLAPGFGLAVASEGVATAFSAAFSVRAGVELNGADDVFGVQLLAQPTLAAGEASGGGATVGLFEFGFTGVIVVTLYKTHPYVPQPPPQSEPREATEATEAAANQQATDDEALFKQIQQHPKFPELGAMKPEAKATCEHERGQWIEQGTKVGCKLRGESLFACQLADDGTMNGCTHWKLGADLTDERDAIMEKNGAPTTSERGERGFRVYTWSTPTKTITLTAYAAGVIVTETTPEPGP
jgi:hypothetical protein